MLTQNQKIAFTSILIEMANADGKVDSREYEAFKCILDGLSIDGETFFLARHIPYDLAISVMERATKEGKMLLAKKLVEMIDADGKVADAELKLLKDVASRLSLVAYFDEVRKP